LRFKQSDAVLYKIELQNFLLDCVKESKKFLPKGPIGDKIAFNDSNVYTNIGNIDQKKIRSIKTAIPGRRSRSNYKPNHIMDRENANKSFQSYKNDPADRVLDRVTQRFIANEDLLADFICKIAMIPQPNEKDTHMSIKETTGIDLAEDQILNVRKMAEGDRTQFSNFENDLQSRETSVEWINSSLIKHVNNSKDVILRKESQQQQKVL
jgi:hypothetical protein